MTIIRYEPGVAGSRTDGRVKATVPTIRNRPTGSFSCTHCRRRRRHAREIMTHAPLRPDALTSFTCFMSRNTRGAHEEQMNLQGKQGSNLTHWPRRHLSLREHHILHCPAHHGKKSTNPPRRGSEETTEAGVFLDALHYFTIVPHLGESRYPVSD